MTLMVACKSFVVLSLAWAMVAALRRLSPAAKHAIWLTATMLLLILPIADRLHLSLFAASTTLSLTPELFTASPVAVAHSFFSWFAIIYCAGAALLLARIVAGHWAVRAWLRGAEPAPELARHLPAHFSILTHPHLSSPLAVGLWRRIIVMPAAAAHWPLPLLSAVLAHEQKHLERHDGLTQTAAQIARALYWFNPLVWVAERALREQRELACDEAALATGTKPSDYASWLMALKAEAPPIFAQAAAMAETSGFGRRIAHILSAGRRLPAGAAWSTGVVFTCAALAVACGGAAAKPRTPPSTATPQSEAKLGSLAPQAIKAVIGENRDAIRACYERELAKNDKLGGTMNMHFTINPDGQVKEHPTIESTLGNNTVDECIAEVIAAIRFPKPDGGVVVVDYPFMFKPAAL